MDKKKRAVSIRMSATDVSNVKRLARRLGVRDSEVIRYAVKALVAKLSPLNDPQARGHSLLPVFVESGTDFFQHFELDALRLESIVNDGVSEEARVDRGDLQLIAMSGYQPALMRAHLGGLPAESVAAGVEPEQALRQYIYGKYIYNGQVIRRPSVTTASPNQPRERS
jgi:hypothetical protein